MADTGIEPHNLPETPHELPYDRGKIDDLLARVKDGATIDLLEETLAAIAWRNAFGTDGDTPLTDDDVARLIAYYREKFADVGPIYLAELLSTEFMTELRARGDITFSDRLLSLGRTDPQLWQEIRQFFRRKEMATALLVMAHKNAGSSSTS
jgi:hypothetical protein